MIGMPRAARTLTPQTAYCVLLVALFLLSICLLWGCTTLEGPKQQGLPELRFSQIMLSGFGDYNEIEAMSPDQKIRYFEIWPEARGAFEQSSGKKTQKQLNPNR